MSQNVKNTRRIIKFIEKNTKGGKAFPEVKIQSAIFLGDALSPLLFVIAVMPLNSIPRKFTKLF